MSVDHLAMQLAMRARALTLSVATTGSTSLSATADGYERAAGSFLTDGFAPGMEVTGTGFTNAANNAAKTLTKVTALAMECAGCVVEAAATRTITVGLPAGRAWENLHFDPTAEVPYVREQYLPGPSTQLTLGDEGQLEVTPMYVLTLYGIGNTDIGSIRGYVDALLGHFKPGTTLTLASGDELRVRRDLAPFAGQLVPREDAPGWAIVPVTIPFRLRTANT